MAKFKAKTAVEEVFDMENNQGQQETLPVNDLPTHPGAFPDASALMTSKNENLKSFDVLLGTISSTEDKQKSLWRQIYENAITDRMNSYLLWTNLYSLVVNQPSEHAMHGQNLARYIERMSKANDQLIKLAELVGNAKKKDTPEVSEDDLYTEMEAEGQVSKH